MDPLGFRALVDLQNFGVILYQCSANDNSELRSYEFGIFIPSMIPCVTENSESLFLRLQKETDNSEFNW